ncbi:MAG: DUF3099 domain-containing protein [Corynebacterium sp.]|nr:DUF3099 domain-containing protein [Corynebacterium sp.]
MRSSVPRFRRRRNVALITSKEESEEESYRRRMLIYNCMQFSRPPLLILAGVSYLVWHNTILSAILFVLCVPISWISVVIANGHGHTRDPRQRQVYKPGAARQQQNHAPALPESPDENRIIMIEEEKK